MRANKMKWNVEKLDSLFDQKPTAPILKIPIPRMLMLDKLALREGGGGGVWWRSILDAAKSSF